MRNADRDTTMVGASPDSAPGWGIEGRSPLVPAVLAFGLGIGLGAWLPDFSPRWALATSIAALVAWQLAARRGHPGGQAAAAAIFFLLLGLYRFQSGESLLSGEPAAVPAGDVTAEGRVAAATEVRDDTLVFELEDVRLKTGGTVYRLSSRLQVFLQEFQERFRPGERLLLRGRLTPLRGDRNCSWFPRPVDPQRRRLYGRLIVSSPSWARHRDRERSSRPLLIVERLRDEAVRFWDGKDRPAAFLLKALTTGQRSGLPEVVRQSFIRSGLAHLLAVSGLHLGFLAFFLYLFFRRTLVFCEPLVLRWPAQPLAAAATIPFLAFIYLFTGQQVSAGRAAVMAGLGLAAVVLHRRAGLPNLVALAALLLLFTDPFLLFSASFQLSFSAVVMLVLAAPLFPERPSAVEGGLLWRRPLWYFQSLLLVSLVAALGTAPVAAWHFHRLSLAGPAANLAAVPLTGFVVLPLGWAALAIRAVSAPWGEAAAGAALRAGDLLIAAAAWCARLRWSSVTLPRPPPLAVLALLALTALLLLSLSGRRRVFALAALAALIVAASSWLLAARQYDTLQAVFLDVGQGEAALLRLPGGETLLVDTGPAWEHGDAGRFVVAPALRKLGIGRIDRLAVSHPHPDHAGGMASLLREFPVGEIWTGPHDGGSFPPETAAAIGRWQAAGGQVRTLRRGDVMDLGGGVRIDILNPPAIPYRGSGSLNDNSLVLLLRWRGFRLLLAGDMGALPAGEIIPRLPPAGRVSVLKVPHHGGRHDRADALVAAFKPDWSVISVGRNRYGHPSPEVVEACGRTGEVLRTDRDGGIFLNWNGRDIEVRTWRELSQGRSWRERLCWLIFGR